LDDAGPPTLLVLATASQLQLTLRPAISRIQAGANVGRLLAVSFDGEKLQVLDTEAPLTFANGGRKLTLRIFVDCSVLEVFANETVCATKIISPLEANPTLEIRAEGGSATVKRIQAWPVKTIW
jgi:sucrose-6-phosphate hydrolase SacC (GH32 family)